MAQEVVETIPTTNSLDIVMNADLNKVTQQLKGISNFQAVVQKTLVSGQDFGTIPGTNKPTLLKPGAEKIIMLMGLTSTYEILEKVEDYDQGFFAYTVRASLIKGNQLITEGLGSANTRETRYKLKGDRGWQDPFTLVNTVLKMAKKRAQVDASLTVGSLSNVFTQDLEDMKDMFEPDNQHEAENDAKQLKVTFGKHNGKTLQEILIEDKKYLYYLKDKAKDTNIRKGAELVLGGTEKSNVQDGNKQVSQSQTKPNKLPQTQIDEIERLNDIILANTGTDIIQVWNATDYKNFDADKAQQFIDMAIEEISKLEVPPIIESKHTQEQPLAATDDDLPF